MAYFLQPVFRDTPDQIYFDIRVNAPLQDIKAGLPVSKDALVTPIRITTEHKQLPDIVFFEDYFCGVSEAAYQLCKKLSPDGVSGHPIFIEDASGQPIQEQYYYLNVLAFRESIFLDETNTIPYKIWVPDGSGNMSLETMTRIDYSKLKMAAEKIEGTQIWHEVFPGYGGQYYIFVSNFFVDQVNTIGLTGFKSAVFVQEI